MFEIFHNAGTIPDESETSKMVVIGSVVGCDRVHSV